MLTQQDVAIESLFKQQGESILQFSNLVAAKVTTKYGAIESIPTLEEIDNDNKTTIRFTTDGWLIIYIINGIISFDITN